MGYDLASLSAQSFSHAQIQPFDDQQIHLFLDRWYTHVLRLSPLSPDDQEELEELYTNLKDNPRLHDLAENPLLLTVLTALHRYERLPDKRILVYDRCADLLLETWAKLRGTNTRWQDLKLSKEDQYACVAHLGFVLHERSQERRDDTDEEDDEETSLRKGLDSDVPSRFMLREIEQFLQHQNLFPSIAEQNVYAKRFLELMQEEAGLIVERGTDKNGEPLYGFVHRTFQEYFAAADVFERYQQEEDSAIISQFLVEHLHDPHWREVILLLLGKLKRKPATVQLRQILTGKIKSRRSLYTQIIQQDLFFVCDCLIEEIAVENDLAEIVISYLSELVKSSSFPSQFSRALEVLVSLMQTRQYVNLAREELIAIVTQETNLDISTIIQASLTLYKNYTIQPIEQLHQTLQKLAELAQRPDLSPEQIVQVAQALHDYREYSPVKEQLHQILQKLAELAQRPDLSPEQAIQVAQTLYDWSLSDSTEEQQAIQKLVELLERPDLSPEQAVQVAQTLYQEYKYSPTESDEVQQLLQRLTNLLQRPDLAPEQAIQVAQTLYDWSLSDSTEQRRAIQKLVELLGRPDLSPEQAVQVAQALYKYSATNSKVWLVATQQLIDLLQYPDSPEQAVQVAQALFECSPCNSPEEYQATHQLMDLLQRDQLSVEQVIKIIQALYQCQITKSDEQHQATHQLMDLLQRPNLSPEQAAQVAQALFECNLNKFEEKQATQRMLELLHQPDLSIEQVVLVSQALYQCSHTFPIEQQWIIQSLLDVINQPHLSIEKAIEFTQALFPTGQSGQFRDEWLRMCRRLLDLNSQVNLTIEQTVLVTQTLYSNVPAKLAESRPYDENIMHLIDNIYLSIDQILMITQTIYECNVNQVEQQATHRLVELMQRSDLSIEHTVQVIQALYKNSTSNTTEQQQASRILWNLARRTDLSFKHTSIVAEVLYKYSLPKSNERGQATEFLWQLAQQQNLAIDQRLQVATIPLLSRGDSNYKDRAQAVQIILTLLKGDKARNYLEEHWQPIDTRISNAGISDLPYIVELVQQELLPNNARDQLYQLLRQMVLEFGSIPKSEN